MDNKSGAPRVLILSGHVGQLPEFMSDAISNHELFALLHGYKYQFRTQVIVPDEMRDPDPVTTFAWAKVDWVQGELESGNWDYIFWIDSDSIFWDLSHSLQDLLSLKKDFVFTGDSWDVMNGGHFLVAASSVGKKFMSKWLELRGTKSQELQTTHKGLLGLLNEQPVANIILSRGLDNSDNISVEDAFNRVNGYFGNPNRRHKLFPYLFAPTNRFRCFFTTFLIHRSLRQFVGVVPQNRLNAYTFKLPGSKFRPRRVKILHFPGNAKPELPYYAQKAFKIYSEN